MGEEWTNILISEGDKPIPSILQAAIICLVSIPILVFSFRLYFVAGDAILRALMAILMFYLAIMRWFSIRYKKNYSQTESPTRESIKSELSKIIELAKLKPIHLILRSTLFISILYLILHIPQLPMILTSLLPLLIAALLSSVSAEKIKDLIGGNQTSMNIVFVIAGIIFIIMFFQIVYDSKNLGQMHAYTKCIQAPKECISATLSGNDQSSASLEKQSEVWFNGIYAISILILAGFTKLWAVFTTWTEKGHKKDYSAKKHFLRAILPNAIIYAEEDTTLTYFEKVRIHAKHRLIDWCKWVIVITVVLPPMLFIIDSILPGNMHLPLTHTILTMAAVLSQTAVVLVYETLTPYTVPPHLTYDLDDPWESDQE